jgi:hypothetical protein
MPSGPYSVFDGYTVTLHRADGSVAGSWPAISGERGHQKPSEQAKRDVGPIPEGGYSFPLSQIQYLSPRNEMIGAFSSLTRRGEWPNSIWAWGTQRVFLVPDASTDTHHRSNFSMHGGWQPGSRGCVDLGPNEDAYFMAVRRLGSTSHKLVVQYDPRLEAEAHPLASQYLFDGVTDYLSRRLYEPAVPKEKPPDVPDEKTAPNPPGDAIAPGQDSSEQGQPQNPADFGAADPQQPDRQWAGARQTGAPQQVASIAAPALPRHVIDTGNYLRANGFEITPRTMYVANVLGPRGAVDLFNRTGSTSSDAVPSPDAATGQQMRAWARQLRLGPAAPAGPPAAPDFGPSNPPVPAAQPVWGNVGMPAQQQDMGEGTGLPMSDPPQPLV